MIPIIWKLLFANFQGFGKADHAQTKRILSTKYPDYTIETSDDGY